jgi:hypothetical protein
VYSEHIPEADNLLLCRPLVGKRSSNSISRNITTFLWSVVLFLNILTYDVNILV